MKKAKKIKKWILKNCTDKLGTINLSCLDNLKNKIILNSDVVQNIVYVTVFDNVEHGESGVPTNIKKEKNYGKKQTRI